MSSFKPRQDAASVTFLSWVGSRSPELLSLVCGLNLNAVICTGSWSASTGRYTLAQTVDLFPSLRGGVSLCYHATSTSLLVSDALQSGLLQLPLTQHRERVRGYVAYSNSCATLDLATPSSSPSQQVYCLQTDGIRSLTLPPLPEALLLDEPLATSAAEGSPLALLMTSQASQRKLPTAQRSPFLP